MDVHLGHVFYGLATRHVEKLVLLDLRLGGLLALADGATAVALQQSISQRTSKRSQPEQHTYVSDA